VNSHEWCEVAAREGVQDACFALRACGCDEVAAREGVLAAAMGHAVSSQQWALQFSTSSQQGPCNQQSAGALQWVPRSPDMGKERKVRSSRRRVLSFERTRAMISSTAALKSRQQRVLLSRRGVWKNHASAFAQHRTRGSKLRSPGYEASALTRVCPTERELACRSLLHRWSCLLFVVSLKVGDSP
jgi:hypothetical protein